MNETLEQMENLLEINTIIEKIKNRKSPILISGLVDVGKVQVLSVINKKINKPICIITYNEIQARELLKNFIELNKQDETIKIKYFPKREISAYEFTSESKDLPYTRIEILNSIQDKKVNVIITTIEAIMQKMILPQNLYKNILKLKVSDTYNIEELKQKLIKLGYERNELIDGRGQFSIRGGIVDISNSDNTGIRIEFWGDEIDSIREFDITTQRSNKMLQSVLVYPSHELILENNLEQICNNIQELQYTDKNDIEKDLELIKSGNYLNKIDKYFNSFYEQTGDLLDYLNDFIVCIDENTKIEQRIESLIKENNNLIKVLVEKQRSISDSIKNISEYKYNLNKVQNIFLERNDIASKQIQEALQDNKDEYNFSNIKFQSIVIENEKKKIKRRKQTEEFKQSEKVVFADLAIGDYVVHKIHGIGQYIGVNTIKADGVTKDYIKIRYKNDDILYVPTNNLDNVRKYIGGESSPKIYKLGGKD